MLPITLPATLLGTLLGTLSVIARALDSKQEPQPTAVRQPITVTLRATLPATLTSTLSIFRSARHHCRRWYRGNSTR